MRHELALAWVAFAFLAIAASPAHFWLDSGEIAAAGAGLGVMHPTGVPGYVALLHLATALPLGSLGLRMALVSSACMAGAIALVVAILRRRGVHWALLWVVGLWIPLALTVARQGRVVEIYAFAALLVAASLWGFDPAVPEPQRLGRRCVGVLAAVIATWGFGDLRLALVLPVVWVWLLAWRRAEPWARWAPACVALASLVVLTLPLASSRGPIADWGDPETWPRIWAHVQATLIRDSYATKLAGMGPQAWLFQAKLVTTRLVEDLGPFGLLLALAALLVGLTRPLTGPRRAPGSTESARERKAERELGTSGAGESEPDPDLDQGLLRWLAWITVVELVYAVAINPMGGRDRQTGLVLVLVAALALGLGVHRATQRRPPLRWVVLPLLACALWIPPAFESLADLRVTRSWAPHAWTREVLARTPSDALVLGQSDDLNAGLLAARALEGARPDLVVIPAQHLYRSPSEWQRGSARRARVWDALAELEGRGLVGRALSPSRTELDRIIAALSSWRGPVVLESPGTAVLAGLDLPGTSEPPIWISAVPIPADLPPLDSDAHPQALTAAIARWDGRLSNPVDRERLADALALAVAGRHARSPESPLRWLEAERGYKLILAEVLADHPRALIGLAAMRDYFGHTDEAIRLTRLALELDPERTTALTNLAFFLARDPATLDEARTLVELAVELAADQRGTWKRLLLICQQQGDAACVARAEARLAGL
jgi:hypothetical protein